MASSSSTIYPDQVARLEPYTSAICRIVRIADNRPLGTGFLIAPGVVATCHHVVPKVAKPGECRAEFYGTAIVDQSDLSTRKVTYFEEIPFDPDESKCITSPQNFDQEGHLLAADVGKLDYSILSLMTNPKLTKVKYFDLFHACTGPMIEQLTSAFVFQHPDIESRDASGLWIKSHELLSSISSKKKTKKIWTRGEFNLATGPLRTCGEYEIHYAPETALGSSGGPVTDAMGNLIALHYQGKIPKCDCQKSTTVLCNAGVRIDQVVEDLTKTGRRQQVEDLIKQNTLRTQSRLTQHITNFYQARKSTISHFGADCSFPLEDIYTDLVIVSHEESKIDENPFQDKNLFKRDNLGTSRIQIKIDQLFQHRKLSGFDRKKRVIVYGCSGMGKTIFSERIAVHVAELWPDQFEIAFLIKLKNLNSYNYPNLGKDYSIEEVLAKEYEICLNDPKESNASISRKFSCSREEWWAFLEGCKRKSLLIFDGFDEFPSESNKGHGALKNIIRDFEAFFDNILITSRPRTVRFYELQIYRRTEFEIIGFDEKGIDDYIKRFYQTAHHLTIPKEHGIQLFQARLKAFPLLGDFLRIPINLALACLVFEDKKSGFRSFDFKPEFYPAVVNLFYGKFLSRLDLKEEVSYEPESDLTRHSKVTQFHQIFQQMAWLALNEDLMQIPEDKITSFCEAMQQPYEINLIRNFGFVRFENMSWEFIHSRFQEFFAGLYLANCYLTLKEKLRKKIKKQIFTIKFKHNFRPVLAIAAGYLSYKLSKSQSDNDKKNIHKSMQFLFDDLSDSPPRDLAKSYELGLFAEFFEEISSPEKIKGYDDYVSSAFVLLESSPFAPAVRNIFHSNPKLFFHERWKSFISRHMMGNEGDQSMPLTILSSVFRDSPKQLFLTEFVKEHMLTIQNDNPLSDSFSDDSWKPDFSSIDPEKLAQLNINVEGFLEIQKIAMEIQRTGPAHFFSRMRLSPNKGMDKIRHFIDSLMRVTKPIIEAVGGNIEGRFRELSNHMLQMPEPPEFDYDSTLFKLEFPRPDWNDLTPADFQARFFELFNPSQLGLGIDVVDHATQVLGGLAQKARNNNSFIQLFFNCSDFLIEHALTIRQSSEDYRAFLNRLLFEIYLARIELCDSDFEKFNQDIIKLISIVCDLCKIMFAEYYVVEMFFVIKVKIKLDYSLNNETIDNLLEMTKHIPSEMTEFLQILLRKLCKKNDDYYKNIVFCLLKFIRSNSLSRNHWMTQLIAESPLSLFEQFASLVDIREFIFLCYLSSKACYFLEERFYVSDSYQVVSIECFNNHIGCSNPLNIDFSFQEIGQEPWVRVSGSPDSSCSSSSMSSSVIASSSSSSSCPFPTTSDTSSS